MHCRLTSARILDASESLQLLLQPWRDLFRPLRGVVAQTGAAELDALTVALTQLVFERIAVRSLEGDIVSPERCLRSANVRREFISRHMTTDLRDEPWDIPADLVAELPGQLASSWFASLSP